MKELGLYSLCDTKFIGDRLGKYFNTNPIDDILSNRLVILFRNRWDIK